MTDQNMGTIVLWHFCIGSRETHTLYCHHIEEVRQMVPLKAGDATAFRKLFNFLIKCQSIEADGHYNLLDTPEIICMVLTKIPLHLR